MSPMAPEQPHGCPRCTRPTRNHHHACDHCLDELTQALNECPWAETELAVTVAGQRGIDYRRLGGSPSSETRIPVHLGASQATTRLTTALATWVRYCADHDIRNQSPTRGIPTNTITAMSRWLLWRIDGLALHDTAPDAIDQITTAIAHAKRIIDRPADKWYAGPCTACGSGMYATAGADTVTCRVVIRNAAAEAEECGNTVDVKERRAELLADAEDRLATAANVARAVSWLGAAPLTSDRVRQWAARDRIFAKGHDSKARPLYRIGDAIDLLAGSAKEATA